MHKAMMAALALAVTAPLAAQQVGETGKAIGIDMTPEMIELARRNAAKANDGKGYSNVEFHLATIDELPLPDNSVDCVISNCVINLASDKPARVPRVTHTARFKPTTQLSHARVTKPHAGAG